MPARVLARLDRLSRRVLGAPILLAPLVLWACAGTPQEAAEPIPGDLYPEAFLAAKDALREHHFDLSRVDAARGIIESHPRSSAGLATPWIDHGDSFSESVDGLIHRDRRRASVRFRPEGGHADASGTPGAEGVEPGMLADLRDANVPFTVEVHVQVERTYVLGRRANPTSIRLMSRAIDPALLDLDLYPVARGEIRDDDELAARIADEIRRTIAD